MIKVLFVCTGNTCRSPMAEVILRKKCKLAGLKNVKVSSAGLNATVGSKMSENSVIALKKMGYITRNFKSKQINARLLLENDVIVCMTENHKMAIYDFPNVYSINELTALGDVFDPYGQDVMAYVKASHQIEDACNILLSLILEGKLPKRLIGEEN